MGEFTDIKNRTRLGVKFSLRSEMLPQTSRSIFFTGCISAQLARNMPLRQSFSGQEKRKCQKQNENVQPVARKQNITKMLAPVCVWSVSRNFPLSCFQDTKKMSLTRTRELARSAPPPTQVNAKTHCLAISVLIQQMCAFSARKNAPKFVTWSHDVAVS